MANLDDNFEFISFLVSDEMAALLMCALCTPCGKLSYETRKGSFKEGGRTFAQYSLPKPRRIERHEEFESGLHLMLRQDMVGEDDTLEGRGGKRCPRLMMIDLLAGIAVNEETADMHPEDPRCTPFEGFRNRYLTHWLMKHFILFAKPVKKPEEYCEYLTQVYYPSLLNAQHDWVCNGKINVITYQPTDRITPTMAKSPIILCGYERIRLLMIDSTDGQFNYLREGMFDMKSKFEEYQQKILRMAEKGIASGKRVCEMRFYTPDGKKGRSYE